MNDRIPDCNSVVTFAGIPEAIFTIVKVGKGASLARFDIQRAYRLLPVSAAHRHLLGMSWKGSFYVDLALPFALRSAPKIFTCFADSLQWIFSRKGGVENVQHYLDDFLLVGPPGSKKCQDELSTCLDFSALLGVPIANDKTEGPAARLTFLGFELDTVTQELRLPESKLVKVRGELSLWRQRRSSTKRESLSLIGLLQHCCQAFVHGRPFLRRLIVRAHSVSEFHHHVELSPWENDDLKWWCKLLSLWNGKSLFFLPIWECAPGLSIASDPAGSIGYAALNGLTWFARKWPGGCESLGIAAKELIPIVFFFGSAYLGP